MTSFYYSPSHSARTRKQNCAAALEDDNIQDIDRSHTYHPAVLATSAGLHHPTVLATSTEVYPPYYPVH
jgi:hypothetical protein